MNGGFIHLDTLIVPQILRQYARGYFIHHSKIFFPVKNNFPVERWEELGFITFKELI